MGSHRNDPQDETSTVLRASVDTLPRALPVYALTVIEGPDRGLAFSIDGLLPNRVLVGQSAACEVRLKDPQVSRRHATLDSSELGLHLCDLSSTNGTTVNGIRIIEAHLRGGEVIGLGGTLIAVEAQAAAPEAPASTEMRFGRVVGASPEMRRLYPLCRRVAESDVPVVLEGETGTGKELLAESLHEASARAGGPFVVFDCTAVAPNLMESSLFGHERGAFTGAVSGRRGVFEQAHGGTLFVDEIGELDPQLQPKLLRAIERGEIQRVGSERWARVDVRVIAATRRDLDREVQEGRFRDDLFYRLAVARIELPPLRQRHGDITVLARHFWRELGGDESGLPEDVSGRLSSYAWPGNVRELRNAIARRLALGDGAPVSAMRSASGAAADGDIIRAVLARELPLARARQAVVDEFESRYVAQVLERYGGNVVRAAAASGIKRRYFQILKARHGK